MRAQESPVDPIAPRRTQKSPGKLREPRRAQKWRGGGRVRSAYALGPGFVEIYCRGRRHEALAEKLQNT